MVTKAQAPYRATVLCRAESPVIVSVPHAGRAYPPELTMLTRHSAADLLVLEDRHADHLVTGLGLKGHQTVVANTPRAWIDLNRAPDDFDPAMLSPAPRMARPLSAKARGGLGLVPRRTSGLGDLWLHPLSPAALQERVELIHEPYHAAIGEALDLAVRRFGAAILIDLHSMPPLPQSVYGAAPQIIIGDRFGRSCNSRFSSRAAEIADRAGLHVGFNVPYAGGYILDRHGKPAQARHALQIEIDRALYLAPNLRDLGAGLDRMSAFVAELATALADEVIALPDAIAAE